MQKTMLYLPQKRLVGIKVPTSYQEELDKTPGKIFPCVQRYFHEALFEKILNRKKPGTTFCAYTEYENDYRGKYSYFIGEEVTSFNDRLPEEFQQLIIPAQDYVKFTTKPEPMPNVIVNAWKEIWGMSSKKLGGERSYQTDFEIYDERAADHQKIIMDVYVGIASL
jgi:predicted transcriptional regulator YdeE